MKSLQKITLFFTILVVAFTPLDAIEISEDSNVTLGRYFFIAMAFSAFWSGDLMAKRQIGIYKTLICFIIWAFTTTTWSSDPEITFVRVLYLVQYAIIFIVMINVLNTTGRLRLAMFGWIIGSAYIAIKTVMDFWENAYDMNDLYRVYDFGNSNENSFILCYALVFCYIIDKTNLRIPSILMTALAAYAIVANAARMGVILFIVAFAGFCMQLWTSKKRWYVFILVPCVLCGAIYMLDHIPDATLARFSGIADNIQDGKFANRENIWRAAVEMMMSNPLWCICGCGWGTFNIVIVDYIGYSIGSHNFYLDVFATTGLIGLIIILYYLKQLFSIIRKTKKSNYLNYLLLILPMISMISTNWQSRRWWFMMGAIIYLLCQTGNFTISEQSKVKG